MKYAIYIYADQTIAYWSDATSPTDREGWTLKPSEATLYDSSEAAAEAMDYRDGDEVEEIQDEAEFRARPDTW